MRLHAVLAAALAVPAFAGSPAIAQSNDPPSRVARISVMNGPVSFQASGATDWSEAALNYSITRGDRLYTAQGSRLELELGSAVVRLGENADVTITDLTDNFLQLGIEQGTLRVSAYRMQRGDTIEVDTPNGAAIVTVPGNYRIGVDADGRATVVSADAGTLDVIGPSLDQEVRSGQAIEMSGTDRIHIASIPRPATGDFDNWSADRDRRASQSACGQYVNVDTPGCEDLNDYGRWESNPEFGVVWYPSHVSADWVPYRDGRWVWIDPWGWSWVDEEPWGFAPFHYGRWTHIGPSWAWVPGPSQSRPYYAPALVAFVGGPTWQVGASFGAQAWFPLGPREAYFPQYHHDDAYLRRMNAANVHVTNINTIINVNVTRTTYVNRDAGVTAVSMDAFRNGRPVSREAMHVRPEEMGRAPVIFHPSAAPVERAASGGPPVARPPVGPRPVIVSPGQRGATPPGRNDRGRGSAQGYQIPPRTTTPPPARTGSPPVQPPVVIPPQRGRGNEPPVRPPVVTPPPARGAGPPPARGVTPPPVGNPPARGGRGEPDRTAEPPRSPGVVIGKTPPPPDAPPFRTREPALQQHPGRPLDPQQVKNLTQGKPAGPPRDAEVPPHKTPPVQQQPPARGAPPAPPPQRGRADSAGRGRGRGGRS